VMLRNCTGLQILPVLVGSARFSLLPIAGRLRTSPFVNLLIIVDQLLNIDLALGEVVAYRRLLSPMSMSMCPQDEGAPPAAPQPSNVVKARNLTRGPTQAWHWTRSCGCSFAFNFFFFPSTTSPTAWPVPTHSPPPCWFALQIAQGQAGRRADKVQHELLLPQGKTCMHGWQIRRTPCCVG